MLNRLQDVFKSFQQREVKYVVIGGVDLDDVRLLELPDQENNAM